MNNLNEVKASHKEFLSPKDIAPILGANAYNISLAARQRPDLLGFPVTVIKTRTKIPRKAFIRFCDGEGIAHE